MLRSDIAYANIILSLLTTSLILKRLFILSQQMHCPLSFQSTSTILACLTPWKNLWLGISKGKSVLNDELLKRVLAIHLKQAIHDGAMQVLVCQQQCQTFTLFSFLWRTLMVNER